MKIIIDEETVSRYTKEYFEMYPKRKKQPIDHPYHPSINQWFVMKRPQLNALKQKWKEFIIWVIEDCGYQGLGIGKCRMTFTTYFPTHRRHDADNYVPKFILDGLVESGFIQDDDSAHIDSIELKCRIDKEHVRTEIEITQL